MVAAIYAVVSLTVGSGLDFDAGQEKALPKRVRRRLPRLERLPPEEGVNALVPGGRLPRSSRDPG